MNPVCLMPVVISVFIFGSLGCQTSPSAPEPDQAIEDAQRTIEKNIHTAREPASWSPPKCPESPYRICTQSDFREANFRGNALSGHVVFFNSNLEGAVLDEANLSNSALHFVSLKGSSLKNTDLSGADLVGASLWGANLERSQLRNANCLGCDFRYANLQDSDLHGANLKGANFQYADLSGANLIDTDLSQVYWHQTICPDGTVGTASCGGHLSFETTPCDPGPQANCADQELSGLDWRHVDLSHANLEAAVLRDTRLQGANLQGTNFAHSNLRGTNFEDADLLGANLLRADLENSHWKNTRCPDGTLSSENGHTCGGHLELSSPPCHVRPEANCRQLDLSGLDLSYANLRGADLRSANLQGTRLEGANLKGAALQNANLAGSDLSFTDLRGALTDGADLSDIITENTHCNPSMMRIETLQCIR